MIDDEDPRSVAGAALVTLRRRVDDHFVAAVQRSPDAFTCRVGCSSCCHVQFGVLGVEADRLRIALGALARHDPVLRGRVRSQALDPSRTACALLVDERCSVYDERPIICRSHGLPIRIKHDDGTMSTETCQLNFVGAAAPEASTLLLDAVNAPLSVIARMWTPDAGRVPLALLAAESASEQA